MQHVATDLFLHEQPAWSQRPMGVGCAGTLRDALVDLNRAVLIHARAASMGLPQPVCLNITDADSLQFSTISDTEIENAAAAPVSLFSIAFTPLQSTALPTDSRIGRLASQAISIATDSHSNAVTAMLVGVSQADAACWRQDAELRARIRRGGAITFTPRISLTADLLLSGDAAGIARATMRGLTRHLLSTKQNARATN